METGRELGSKRQTRQKFLGTPAGVDPSRQEAPGAIGNLQRGGCQSRPKEDVMFAPYHPLHTVPKVPEQPIDPPELSDHEYDRNVRNSLRTDGIESIDRLESVLDDLSDENGQGFQNMRRELAHLRDYLLRDMED
jgi:hypothetical protein